MPEAAMPEAAQPEADQPFAAAGQQRPTEPAISPQPIDPQIAAVRAAGRLLDSATDRPLVEQVAVFSEVHSRLQSALADVESAGN